MKIKDNFLLKEVAGKTIVVPVGQESLNFNAVITLNETGAFLFNLMQKEDRTVDSLADEVLKEYEVTREKAIEDIKKFTEKAVEAGITE